MRRFAPVLLGLLALSSSSVAVSGAAGTKPEPSCGGVAANDVKGDSVSHPAAVNPITAAGADNLDITRFWFDRSGGKTTANIEVKKLTKAISAGSGAKPSAISWYVEWTSGDAVHFVDATSDGNSVGYSYGDLTANQYSETDGTSGSFFDGDLGVISIVIPTAIGGGVGTKLEEPAATTFENTDSGAGLSLLGTADNAPDTGGGKAWTVTDCAPAAGADLGVTAATKLGSAKKAKKGKTVKVALTGNAAQLTATLKKGATTYGTGSLPGLTAKGTLKLKLSKSVKKGSYTLALDGKNADGAQATKSFKVKFTK